MSLTYGQVSDLSADSAVNSPVRVMSVLDVFVL